MNKFYFEERLFLLKCLKYILSYWQDPFCLFRVGLLHWYFHSLSQSVLNLATLTVHISIWIAHLFHFLMHVSLFGFGYNSFMNVLKTVILW